MQAAEATTFILSLLHGRRWLIFFFSGQERVLMAFAVTWLRWFHMSFGHTQHSRWRSVILRWYLLVRFMILTNIVCMLSQASTISMIRWECTTVFVVWCAMSVLLLLLRVSGKRLTIYVTTCFISLKTMMSSALLLISLQVILGREFPVWLCLLCFNRIPLWYMLDRNLAKEEWTRKDSLDKMVAQQSLIIGRVMLSIKAFSIVMLWLQMRRNSHWSIKDFSVFVIVRKLFVRDWPSI